MTGRTLILAGLLLLAVSAGYAQMPATFNPMMAGQVKPTCTDHNQNGTLADTMGLWHLDGNLIDSSRRGHDGTIMGNAAISTAMYKFGTGSVLMASSSAVNVGISSDWNFGSGTGSNSDFTVEYWGFQTTVSPTYSGVWGDSGTSITVDQQQSVNQNTTIISGNQQNFPFTRPNNVWAHWAWVRQNGVVRVYLNGVMQASPQTMSGQAGSSTVATVLGATYTSNILTFPGYVDEFRVSKVARYTENFTPAELPFCDVQTPYVGIGNIAGGALAWMGLRSYSSQAANDNRPIANVRRNSDGVTCDVLPVFLTGRLGNTNSCLTSAGAASATNNNLAIGLFCGAGCTVAKVYDQTSAKSCGGAACDAVQSVAANQPALNFNCFGNLPCLNYSTATQRLTTPVLSSVSQPFSVQALARRANDSVVGPGGHSTFFVQGTSQTQFGFSTPGSLFIYNGGSQLPSVSGAEEQRMNSLLAVFNGASSSITANATTSSPVSVEDTAASGAIDIGHGASTNTFNGTISEVGIWPRNLSPEMPAICTQQWSSYGYPCGQYPAGDWHTIATANPTTGGSAFTNYLLRTNWFAANFPSDARSGTQIRVTFTAGGNATSIINQAWIGHGANNTNSNVDFDGTQVQLTFNGNLGVTITPNTTVTSDPINYQFNPAKNLITSIGWGSSNVVFSGTCSGCMGQGTPGGTANAGATLAGFTANVSYSYVVSQIEAYY